MQAELDSEGIDLQIIGVNATGKDGSNDVITADRDLPWLQDVAAADVWGTWAVTYRDVIMVDAKNKIVSVYNLTDNDLKDAANYESLKALIVEAAP